MTETRYWKKLETLVQPAWLLPVVIILALGTRLLVAARGHNYDMDSFLLVADIVQRGANVYANTDRYNYGPVWFNLLAALNRLALLFPDRSLALRYLIAGLLSLVDLGICAILWRKIGRLAAYLFLLNPVSILITGYHSQFDNLALFLGLLAVVIVGDDGERPLNGRKLLGLVVLGFSLMTKHFLFAFPLWLAAKQKGIWQKCLVIAVPLLVFGLGFVPYWPGGGQGIIANVFRYESWNNEFFYRWFVPFAVQVVLSSRLAWIGLLAVGAFVFRPRNVLDSLLLYTGVLVAASPAIANQYLAIPVPFMAANVNVFFILYTALGTWHLLVNEHGLHLALPFAHVRQNTYYVALIILLCAGFVWLIWHPQIVALARKVVREVEIQGPR